MISMLPPNHSAAQVGLMSHKSKQNLSICGLKQTEMNINDTTGLAKLLMSRYNQDVRGQLKSKMKNLLLVQYIEES